MMDAAGTAGPSRDWRRIAFYVVVVLSALVVLVLFGSAFSAFSPWLAEGGEGPPPGYDDPASHRWHDAQWAAHTGILLGGSLLALLWRPLRRPLLVQFVVVAAVVLALLGIVVGSPEFLIVLIPIALVVALYPNRQTLLEVPGPGNFFVPVLVLAVIAAGFMAPDAWDKLELQLNDAANDEHAEHNHWIGSTLLLVNLLVAGVLSATRRPGWRVLAVITGLAFIYLGIAVLSTRDWVEGVEPVGLWSTMGGVLALLAGIGYIGLTLVGDRLQTRPSASEGRAGTA